MPDPQPSNPSPQADKKYMPFAESVEKRLSTPAKKDYGARPDGSKKSKGWVGEIYLENGDVATEFSTQSDAVKVNGKRIDFPTLVPTLTPEELDAMKKVIATNGAIPEGVMQKAIQHARKRLSENKSVFAED
jgi:hypothetical protein